jgi:Ribbon-helix-helix protein, copG family
VLISNNDNTYALCLPSSLTILVFRDIHANYIVRVMQRFLMSERNGHVETFPGRLLVQTPIGLNKALDELAARQRTTRSELVRRALMREVADAGVQIGEPEKVANHA